MTASVEYRQGYAAGRLGVLLSANPYSDRTELAFREWRRGWLAAEGDVDDLNVTRQFREPRTSDPASTEP